LGSSLLETLAVLMITTIALLATRAAAHSEACATALTDARWHPPAVVAGEASLDFEALVAKLAEERVVMIGEVHDRYDHHLNQLELVCRLHRRHADLAIGLEFFQQPFQDPLDAYLDLRIDTPEMLAQTEYYDRWHFDYRLYAPILEFARGRGIPLVALNAPEEISSKVAKEGIAGLSEAERAQFPAQLERGVPGYRERLQAVFDEHPEVQHMSFENFVEAQLIWDESMAERAARYLDAHPDRRLVVLAGDGHIIRNGIPLRFGRRSGVEAVNLLQGELKEFAPEGADYVLISKTIELPRVGKIGVMLDTSGDRVVVSDFSADSAAKDIGILTQDRIVELDGKAIASLADLKFELIDKRPGDAVSVKVERVGSGEATSEVSFSLTLR
jgi:uncharacterized iron-regulated protein